MRKLLSLFTATTLITTSTTSLVACNTTPQGNPVPVFVYNGNQKFSHAPTVTGKSVNGIDNAAESGKDETGAPYEYSLQGRRMGLISNVVVPFLTGINLTKDNSKTTVKGANWTPEQIAAGLQEQKDNIIANAKIDGTDPFDNAKKINQKTLWEEFFTNYSTSYDSYYTQVGLTANENPTVVDPNNQNLVTMSGNAEKTSNKDWVKEHTWGSKKWPYTPPSLKTLSPVATILDWLNDPNNNYNKGFDQINENRGYQSARYLAITIPNVTIRFEFQGEHKRFTFSAIIDKLVAYANYLVYKNPNSSTDKPTYAHQWFFLSYGFYDFSKLTNDDYHDYNFKIPVPNIDPSVSIALGYVKKGDKDGILTADEDKKVDKNGQFPSLSPDYAFPDLKWKINVDSMTDQYK
ncbi:lipoprotein [Spiroplasma endosymbiont of Sarcophaga variegata]|uniref:lipoprotein n=1 Tax=Spiroplasma endosymbiont of Sarcophaga variegata TaxID=3066304 RepID=UPI003AF49862